MQKICHGERFICTETPEEADGIPKTLFLFEMSRTTSKTTTWGQPLFAKVFDPDQCPEVQLFVYGRVGRR